MAFKSILNTIMSLKGYSKNPNNKAIIEGKKSVHEFDVETIDGKKLSLSKFRGKKILIVNTASQCGFTGHYKGLESLYNEYKQTLVVLAFPANNFGGQEPGQNEEIKKFCEIRFKITFPIMAKNSVKGKNIQPLFEWLVSNVDGGDVLWNFEKFLIDEEGKILDRFRSTTKPQSPEILRYLNKP